MASSLVLAHTAKLAICLPRVKHAPKESFASLVGWLVLASMAIRVMTLRQVKVALRGSFAHSACKLASGTGMHGVMTQQPVSRVIDGYVTRHSSWPPRLRFATGGLRLSRRLVKAACLNNEDNSRYNSYVI